jgi:putative peptidoglycan lipid II flippase
MSSTATLKSPHGPSTLQSSLKFGLISLFAYGFSFGKSVLVARYFGTSTEMDAFTLAVLLPNLLASLLTGGFAISLVPALAVAEKKGQRERANTFRAGLLLFTSVALLATVVLAMLAKPTMVLVAPGFSPDKRSLAAELLRWCAGLLPLNAVYAYCSAELLSRKRYAAVAAAPIISTAVSVAILVPFASSGVKVLALGLVVGTLCQAVIVATPAWAANQLRATVRWRTPEVRELIRQQLPLLLISTFGVANLSVDQFMAGLLPSGSASALSFASNLNMVVSQVVVMAASWVILPEFSKLAAEGDHQMLALKVRQAMLGIARIAIPVVILILALGESTVGLLFQHGRFDSKSTHDVSRIWIGYTFGLLPFAIAMIPVRLLNAMRQNQFLVSVGIAALVINAGLDFLLMRWIGAFGISLSTSLVYICTSILVLRFVHCLFPGIFKGALLIGIVNALLVCLPTGIGLFLFKQRFSGITAVLAGGALFVVVVLSLYHLCGMVHIPFRKYRPMTAQ